MASTMNPPRHPMLNRLKHIDHFDFFNLGISALIVLLIIYFSVPFFVFLGIDSAYVKAHHDLLTSRSVIYSILGLVAFIIGYWFLGRAKSPRPIINIQNTWIDKRILWVFFLTFAAGFSTKIYRLINGSYLSHMYIDAADPLLIFKFFISLNMFHFIALAMAFTYYYWLLKNNDAKARLWAWIAWGTFTFQTICGLLIPGGRLAMIIPIVIALMTKHYLYSRSNGRIIVAGLLVVFVLFPVKNFLRDVPSVLNTYFANNKPVFTYHPDKSPDTKDIFYTISKGEITDTKRYAQLNVDLEKAWGFAADSSVGRLGQAHTFAAIITKTDSYRYGKDFVYALAHLGLPRSFISKITGIEEDTNFGLRHGLVSESWTGVAPTIMGDLYLNFGWAGIIAGMLLLGILLRRIFDFLLGLTTPSGAFIYSILWIVLMHTLEQSVSAMVGRTLQLGFILFILHLGLTVMPRKLIRSVLGKLFKTPTTSKSQSAESVLSYKIKI